MEDLVAPGDNRSNTRRRMSVNTYLYLTHRMLNWYTFKNNRVKIFVFNIVLFVRRKRGTALIM